MDNFKSSTKGSITTPILISLAGLMGTTIAIVAYHLMLVRYCIRRQRRASFHSSQIQRGANMEEPQGVEKEVLDAIPIFTYSSKECGIPHNLLRGHQNECVICLGELEEGEKIRLLPNCGHVFHVPCIDDWFLAHSSCPICRAPIVGLPPIINACEDQESSNANTLNLAQFLERREEEGQEQEGDQDHNVNGPSNPRLLRHSVSFALPVEGKPRGLMGLKRSFSMDQSFIVIDIQRESEKHDDSSSSSFSSNSKGVVMDRGCRTQSIRQSDRMSALLRSFSQTRMGRSVVGGGLLPY